MRPKDKTLNFIFVLCTSKAESFQDEKSIQLVVLITVNCNSGKNPGGGGNRKFSSDVQRSDENVVMYAMTYIHCYAKLSAVSTGILIALTHYLDRQK